MNEKTCLIVKKEKVIELGSLQYLIGGKQTPINSISVPVTVFFGGKLGSKLHLSKLYLNLNLLSV
jgi:hypothetical protein